MRCQRCDVELIAHEKARSVSVAGLIGAMVALAGIVTLFSNALIGIGLIVLGAILGSTMRRKRLVLICPKCKTVTGIT